MVSLACADHPSFMPSLAEFGSPGQVHYSIDTVRRFRHELHAADRLFFILGADQFLELPTWKNHEALLGACDFIIAHRPGFRLDALKLIIPPEMIARAPTREPGAIALRHSVIHLLSTVSSNVSSTEIRRCRHRNESIRALVPPRVEEYILKQALYR